MDHEFLPRSDLVKLKREVLDLPPEFSLPCNLPGHWLDLIARDLDEAMRPNEHVGDAAGVYASAPLALILRILQGKSPGPTLSMSCEMLWEYFLYLRTEINLEILSRRTEHKLTPATLETIFSNRQVRAISALGDINER